MASEIGRVLVDGPLDDGPGDSNQPALVAGSLSGRTRFEQGSEVQVFHSNDRYVNGNDGAEVIDWNQLKVSPWEYDQDSNRENKQAVEDDDLANALNVAPNQFVPPSPPEGAPGVLPEPYMDVPDEEMDEAGPEVRHRSNDHMIIAYDRENPVVKEGAMFPSMAAFREALTKYAIRKQFDVKKKKNCKERYIGSCTGEFNNGSEVKVPCKWKISVALMGDGVSVRVNECGPPHSCETTCRKTNSFASQAWVADRCLEELKKNPNKPARQMQKDFMATHNVNLSYHTVWKAKERALAKLFGSWVNSFHLLYNFKAEIEKRQPGSVVEVQAIEVGGKMYFNRFFMALKPCIDGFKNGCRPYLSVDATCLTRRWNGQLAGATALDGHNWLFPVAIGLFQSETEESWEWFLENLKRAIGHVDPIAIHTDACKGLETAVHKVFPHAEQRECLGHLMLNMFKHYAGDALSRMWPAAKAYKTSTFNYHMNIILGECPELGEYLKQYHSLLWMRSAFNPAIKCDYINNNLAESFNSWIKELKDLPVHELVDGIRQLIMYQFQKRREIGRRLRGHMLPVIIKQLNGRTRHLGHLSVGESSIDGAEVKDRLNNWRYVVKINQRECSCLEWQHTGKPCDHALAFLIDKRTSPYLSQYVHDYFSLDMFRAAYAGVVEPCSCKEEWPQVQLEFELCQPVIKRGIGRPKASRFKNYLEKSASGVPPGANSKGKNRCTRCNELGHRAKGCPLNGPKKRNRQTRCATADGVILNQAPAAEGPTPAADSGFDAVPEKDTERVPSPAPDPPREPVRVHKLATKIAPKRKKTAGKPSPLKATPKRRKKNAQGVEESDAQDAQGVEEAEAQDAQGVEEAEAQDAQVVEESEVQVVEPSAKRRLDI